MRRRDFLKKTIAGASAFFIPNAVFAAGKNSLPDDLPVDVRKTLFTQPDLADYKFNTDGTAFFKTRIGFQINSSKQLFLPREFRVTHDENGYGTPTLYFDGANYHIFVTELFLSYKMNGWVYKYNEKTGFTSEQIYQHDNMGWYAFWGRSINGQPALYHYQYTNGLMRQSTIENGVWVTNTIFNTPPQGAIELYNSQLNHVDYNTQANQFGFDYQVHRDGVYDFLKLKYDWEQSVLKKEKDLAELGEKTNPTLLSSLENPLIARTIRNRQSLANSDCNYSSETGKAKPENIRIVKTQNLRKNKTVEAYGEMLYQTKLAFYDAENVLHKIPDQLHCSEDALGQNKPVLLSDGYNYFIYTDNFEQGNLQRVLYKYNDSEGWQKESAAISEDLVNANLIALAKSEKPIIFFKQQPNEDKQAKWITADYEKSLHHVNESELLLNRILAEQPDDTNAFVPIYCEGDDTSRAITKPKVLYKEVLGTKIEIPNMPAVKTQDNLGECRAFSLAVIYQKYICERGNPPITDCANPPPDKAISYFGMLAHTNQLVETDKTFVPDQDQAVSMYDIIRRLAFTGNKFILESCKPLEKLVENFTLNGVIYPEHAKKRDEFFAYLKNIHETQKASDILNIKDCQSCVEEINKLAGLNLTMESFKEALTNSNFNGFLYELFFTDCKRKSFPFANDCFAYPLDIYNVTAVEILNKIIEGLKLGKPVLVPQLCLSGDNTGHCKDVHSVVISGYKQVSHPKDKKVVKNLFKVHNSWGEDWQKINNNGWCDADVLTQHNVKVKNNGTIRNASQSVLWLYP